MSNLFQMTVKDIRGRSLIVTRSSEDDEIFQQINHLHPELVDCTYTTDTRRYYFFSYLTPEDRIQKFLDIYNRFGRKRPIMLK